MGIVTSYGASKLADGFLSEVVALGKGIRERHFFEEFMKSYPEELVQGRETARLDDLFRKIKKAPKMQEMLFEAYRKVCLSASRELGPKIIGILSSVIISQDRVSDVNENRIFEACEVLNDDELREMVVRFSKIRWLDENCGKWGYTNKMKMLNGRVIKNNAEFVVHRGTFDYEFELEEISYDETDTSEQDVSKPLVEDYLGRWAVKLKMIDIVRETQMECFEREYKGNKKVSRKTKYTVIIDKYFIDAFIPLIERATGPSF